MAPETEYPLQTSTYFIRVGVPINSKMHATVKFGKQCNERRSYKHSLLVFLSKAYVTQRRSRTSHVFYPSFAGAFYIRDIFDFTISSRRYSINSFFVGVCHVE